MQNHGRTGDNYVAHVFNATTYTTFFLLALGQRHIFFRLTNNGNVPCLAKPLAKFNVPNQ